MAALTDDPASLRDTSTLLDDPTLHRRVAHAMAQDNEGAAIDQLSAWLAHRAGALTAEALLANRLADRASTDPAIRTVAELAASLPASERTVHRLTARYIGLTPHALIRRRRLQEAAEEIRRAPNKPLSDIAAEHGFSDHAHLTREFRRAIGSTPGEYRTELHQATEAPPHGE